MIRPATLADLDWLSEGARSAYAAGTYDEADMRAWLSALTVSPDVLFLRGDRAAVVTAIGSLPYKRSHRFAYLLPLASTGRGARELVQMLDMAIKWARERGARHFDFAATTGVDLGPLARRFGAKPISPAYRLDLTEASACATPAPSCPTSEAASAAPRAR